MSIADQLKLQDAIERIAELERRVGELETKVEVVIPQARTLHLKDKKRG